MRRLTRLGACTACTRVGANAIMLDSAGSAASSSSRSRPWWLPFLLGLAAGAVGVSLLGGRG